MNSTTRKTVSMIVGIFLLAVASIAYGADGGGKKLDLKKDLKYLGAFRVPQKPVPGMATQSTMSGPLTYGGELLTFNPHRNSLYVMGSQNAERLVYEISIPEPIISETLTDLNTAEFLTGGFDITGGVGWDALHADGSNIVNGGYPGGLLFLKGRHQGRMIGNSFGYSDSASSAVNSHFVTNSTLSDTPDFMGYYAVGLREDSPGRGNGGFVGGYMGWIPSEWQAALKGSALTGLGGVGIITRSSFGPSVSVFDPEDLLSDPVTTVSNPVNAKMLVGYPAQHPSLGEYAQANKFGDTWGWNGMGSINGVVFPEGTRSILFFGRMGMGNSNYGAGDVSEGSQCYGSGTANPLEAGNVGGESCGNGVVASGNRCCYDPTSSAKGNHAYPYKARIWAYDAGDLQRVADNSVQPWEILPYEMLDFDFPYITETINGMHNIGQVTYDPATQRIYISQLKGDNPGYARYPVIHVYEVDADKPTQELEGGKRLDLKKDLEYQGAFRVPKAPVPGVPTQSEMSAPLTYGGELLTFNPHRNSLYIMGSHTERLVYEISIPEPVNSDKLTDLNTAEFLTGGFDITGGVGWSALLANGDNIVNGGKPGGLLFLKGKDQARMIGNSYGFYDGSALAVNSHFVTNSTLSGMSDFMGYYAVGLREDSPGRGNGGFVGGYMCWIPSEWQSALKGPALTGRGGGTTITRSSFGPSASVFNPEDLLSDPITTVSNPVNAKMLVGYPAQHTTLGEYNQAYQFGDTWGWNGTGYVNGIVFPEGTRSVLFFGRIGMGNNNYGAGNVSVGSQCYGPGTPNRSEAGRGGGELCHTTVIGPADHCCYDPANTSKGPHSYPYKARIWAYDAGDLKRVADNSVQPWEILPYEMLDFDFPYLDEPSINGLRDIGQATYDPATQRIYISQMKGDNLGSSRYPVIHVYKVKTGN